MLQLQRSNQTQVYLGEVSPSLAGNLSCEVTTDENFITRMVYTNLVVAGGWQLIAEQRCALRVAVALRLGPAAWPRAAPPGSTA